MNYHNITHDDMLNGDGLRAVLWVAGCEHHCDECQNPITWEVNGGIKFSDDAKEELFHYVAKDYTSGITFSGGDPLNPANRRQVLQLAKEAKELWPDKTIWVYTGYDWEYVNDLPVIDYIDVLVDGRYVKELRDTNLHWVGSSNQRVIDVKRTKDSGHVVLLEDNVS